MLSEEILLCLVLLKGRVMMSRILKWWLVSCRILISRKLLVILLLVILLHLIDYNLIIMKGSYKQEDPITQLSKPSYNRVVLKLKAPYLNTLCIACCYKE